MHIIPTPQKITLSTTPLPCRSVRLCDGIEDRRLLDAASKLPQSPDGLPLRIVCGSGDSEGYRLHLGCDGIVIESDGVHGAFYGVQTLRQIFMNEQIFCAEIEDSPSNPYRILYHDVTRGRVPTLRSLKQLVDDISFYKLNGLQLYVEHAFPFREMYGTIDESNYLTPEEIVDLVNYCEDHFVDLVPSLATCGHMYRMLQLPQNAHLRELDNYEPQYMDWYESLKHHTINPALPESFEFVKSLIDQYIPLFSSRYVNVCGDEPFDLKIGKNAALGIDVDRMYIDFMVKVIDYVKSKGKKVMLWADSVFLDNPEHSKAIPDDVIMLCWGYAAEPPESRVQKLEGRAQKKLVCPSNSAYFRLCENAAVAEQNICNMAAFGAKYAADGMMNTNWGDYGHPCSIELSMYGIVVGAQKSWDFGSPVDEDFHNAVSMLLYRQERGYEYLRQVNTLHEKAQFFKFARLWSDLTHESKIPYATFPTDEELTEAVEQAKQLMCELESQKWASDNYRRAMLIAAEGTAVIAELFMALRGTKTERTTDTESWLSKYRAHWLEQSKESELCRIEEMFRQMQALAERA